MRKYLFSLIITIIFFNCSESPNESKLLFDDRIIGEWGAVTPLNYNDYPSPPYSFYGLQILETEMNVLGIQHSTGRIKTLEDSPFRNLRFLENNKIEVYVRALPAEYLKTINYAFSNDSLILDYGHYKRKFSRVKIDSTIFESQPSTLKFMYGNKWFKNVPISSSLSAYASKLSESTLLIKGYTDGFNITLKINNFSGKGYYRIPEFFVEMSVNNSDAVWRIETDSTSIGEIRVSNYDENRNTCSGYFSFTDYHFFDNMPPRYTDVRGGYFIVPIYK